MRRVIPVALLGGLLGCCMPASAGLLGTDILFECPQCTPATADHFIAKAGVGDYALKSDDYTWHEVDVEASTITIKNFIDGYTRSPLVFRLTWSPAQYHLLSASVASDSTFVTGYSWAAGELLVNMGDQFIAQGTQITFNLTAAPVPEPSAVLLGPLGAAFLLWRRRRAVTAG
jgi:hypothetical protein